MDTNPPGKRKKRPGGRPFNAQAAQTWASRGVSSSDPSIPETRLRDMETLHRRNAERADARLDARKYLLLASTALPPREQVKTRAYHNEGTGQQEGIQADLRQQPQAGPYPQ